jgi:hypothetical protein
MPITLPDNLKTLSVGDIVHVFISWSGTVYFDDDGKVIEYSSETGATSIEFISKKNPDGSKLKGSFGVWAIQKIVKEGSEDSEPVLLKQQIAALTSENIKLKNDMTKISTIVSIYK